jgi:chromosome segregation ATPase
MSEDEIQRQIDFIIAQQARFAEQQARSAERQARIDERIAKLNEEFNEKHGKFREDLVMLKDVVLSLANIVDRHDRDIAALIERGKETDERLNTLVAVVERLITERGNDHKP